MEELKKGMNLEEAIDWKDPKVITVFKNTEREFTGNKKQIAEHFKIKKTTLLRRIEKGLTVEEAINYIDNRWEKFTIFKDTNKEFTGNYA